MNYQRNNSPGRAYNPSYSNRSDPRFSVAKPIKPLRIPADYLEQAEEWMETNASRISTSKIRRIYSLATDIYNRERLRTDEKLSAESIAAVGMMRVRIAYESGRDSKVKDFVTGTHLIEYLKGVGDSRESFIKLTQYMEALVAYHKFFGGKENG